MTLAGIEPMTFPSCSIVPPSCKVGTEFLNNVKKNLLLQTADKINNFDLSISLGKDLAYCYRSALECFQCGTVSVEDLAYCYRSALEYFQCGTVSVEVPHMGL
jgi:hypothetical protein